MLLYINYPSWISPYVFSFLPVRWYALMYVVAFAISYMLFSYEMKRDGILKMTNDERDSLYFIAILLLLVGARLFSCLFYSDTAYYLTHPWMIFWPFEDGQFVGLPGMSYHGGVAGCILGGWIFSRKYKKSFLQIADAVCASIPLGYTFGRLGNFINAELYGRVTDSPVGMIFPTAERFSTNEAWVREIADKVGLLYSPGDMINLPRHPAQLYEAFFEGIVLFLILWFIFRPLRIKGKTKDGVIIGAYLLFYGLFRFIIEYFREPDRNIGYVLSFGEGSDNIALFTSWLNISKGQVFCFLMIILGLGIILFAEKRGRNDDRGKNRKAEKAVKRKKH